MPNKRNSQSGMTLIGTLVAMAILAIVMVPTLAAFHILAGRYAKVIAKKAVFALADEFKTTVAVDIKSYFTSRRPKTPCRGEGDLMLSKSTPLRSGAELTVLNEVAAAALPAIPNFPLYDKAKKFCEGKKAALPAKFSYPPVDFSSVPAEWAIFNPPSADFSGYTSFDFCAQISCPPGEVTGFNKMCQYATDAQHPMLVVFRYEILNAGTGTPFSCGDTIGGWPDGAVGKLSYLILWAQSPSITKASSYLVDAGIYHANKADN